MTTSDVMNEELHITNTTETRHKIWSYPHRQGKEINGAISSKGPTMNSSQHPRPPDGPQRRPDEAVADIAPATYSDPEDVVAVAELAEAERAVARHHATPAQTRGVETAAQHRRGEDRVDSWRSDNHSRPEPDRSIT